MLIIDIKDADRLLTTLFRHKDFICRACFLFWSLILTRHIKKFNLRGSHFQLEARLTVVLNSGMVQKYANSHFPASSFYCNVFYELQHGVDISCSNFIPTNFGRLFIPLRRFLFYSCTNPRTAICSVTERKMDVSTKTFYIPHFTYTRLVSDKYKFVYLKADRLRSPKMKRREQSWPTWSGTTFGVSKRNLAKSRPSFVIPWNLGKFQKPT